MVGGVYGGPAGGAAGSLPGCAVARNQRNRQRPGCARLRSLASLEVICGRILAAEKQFMRGDAALRALRCYFLQECINSFIQISVLFRSPVLSLPDADGPKHAPFVADHTLGIDQVQRGPTLHVPSLGNRATGTPAVPERPPGNSLLGTHLPDCLSVLVTIDADDGEWLAFQPFHERPLVGHIGPARPSPVSPEVEQHHLPPVIAQPEIPAVQVSTLDLRCGLPDREML